MSQEKNYSRTSLLIVGAGPSGLACAIAAKKSDPALDVCVIDKAADLGNHNLSGAVLEPEAVKRLLSLLGMAEPQQSEAQDEALKDLLARRVERDDLLFLPGKTASLNLSPVIKAASALRLSAGQMRHDGDFIVSIAKLTKWMGVKARELGVEVLTGFAAEELLAQNGSIQGVKLVDLGRDKEGGQQPNYLAGESIEAKVLVLAEGCDGLLTERFIERAGLKRRTSQLFSVGIKEVIKVSPEQYARFGDKRVVHALGYPIWSPVFGPGSFGGGLMYSYGDDCIAVGMIVGLDWAEYDFNPQDALTHFKNHAFVAQYIEGGKVIEAGAKMIPEGGLFAIPRDPETNAIGRGNVIILGDSAGFVNMLKIKGLHNAIESGLLAGQAAAKNMGSPGKTAADYTAALETSPVMGEMQEARKFRQVIAKFGNLVGMPLSAAANALPLFDVDPDYKAMRRRHYRFKGNKEFDKDTFTALAHTEHREDQPVHVKITNPSICAERCRKEFQVPCITFCPAGVYEEIQGALKPANASNCLHCKTCQRKCPFDNIRWTVPEGGGGPRYKTM